MIKKIFLNENNQLILLIIVIVLYTISWIFWFSWIIHILDIFLKIVFILGVLSIISLLREIKETRTEIISKITKLDSLIKKISWYVKELYGLDKHLNNKILWHIELDLKRDHEFLKIIWKFDDILWKEIKNYNKIIEEENNSKSKFQ